MTKKTKVVGRESGKSSISPWWRNSNMAVDNTEAGQHGHGARAGDGRTDRRDEIGKIRVVYRRR